MKGIVLLIVFGVIVIFGVLMLFVFALCKSAAQNDRPLNSALKDCIYHKEGNVYFTSCDHVIYNPKNLEDCPFCRKKIKIYE